MSCWCLLPSKSRTADTFEMFVEVFSVVLQVSPRVFVSSSLYKIKKKMTTNQLLGEKRKTDDGEDFKSVNIRPTRILTALLESPDHVGERTAINAAI